MSFANDNGNVPYWWTITKRVLTFALGIFCVIYAVVTPGHDVAFLTVGLILIGVLPIDDWLIIKTEGLVRKK